MTFHPITRRAAANLSILGGVIAKLAGPAAFSSAAQTVRSLVLPLMRMTPFSPSDRISPSVEALFGVK
jgi:hypothetical protein